MTSLETGGCQWGLRAPLDLTRCVLVSARDRRQSNLTSRHGPTRAPTKKKSVQPYTRQTVQSHCCPESSSVRTLGLLTRQRKYHRAFTPVKVSLRPLARLKFRPAN